MLGVFTWLSLGISPDFMQQDSTAALSEMGLGPYITFKEFFNGSPMMSTKGSVLLVIMC